MAYSDTPQPTQRINETQPLIRTNFTTIQATFSVNHEAITGAGGDEGKHSFIQMPEQGAAPVTAANEGAIYTAVGATSGVTELYFRRESSGSAIAMTESNLAAAGYTYLPCGLLMKWGISTATGVTTFTNAVAPYYTTLYNVQVTPITQDLADSNLDVILLTTVVNAGVNFQLNVDAARRLSNTAATCQFYWMTLGV